MSGPRSATFSAILTVLLGTVYSNAAHAQTSVTACGQVYSGDGILAANLTCTDTEAPAIRIEGGSLDLAGFTLDAPHGIQCAKGGCEVHSSSTGAVIQCPEGVGIFTRGISGGPLTIHDFELRNCHYGAITGTLTAYNMVFSDYRVSSPVISALRVHKKGLVEDSSFTGANTAIDCFQGSLTVRRTTIADANSRGITTKKIHLSDSTIRDGGDTGINAGGGKIERVVLQDNALIGLDADRIRAADVTVTGSATGIVGTNLRLDRITATGNSQGIDSDGRLKLRDSEVSGNLGHGIVGPNLNVRDSDIVGNGGAGLRAFGRLGSPVRKPIPGRLKIRDSVVANNGQFGILADSIAGDCEYGSRASATHTAVTGNGTIGDCGTAIACADLAGCSAPRVGGGASCMTSYVVGSGIPGTNWGICSND